LESERRKRGVAGKGGKDMSHTKTGEIVPEDPHRNRARSHPSVGSTLKMVVVKAPQMNLDGQSAECELCGTAVDAQTAQMMNEQFGASVCTPCIMKEQEQINQQNDMMYHSEPMDIAMRLLKEQKKLFVQGQKTLDGRPAFTPTDFAAEEQRRQAALMEAEKKEQRRQAAIAQAKKIGLTPLPFQQNPE
jgi:ribosome-binding protein aMBF1 (putative translation factor)